MIRRTDLTFVNASGWGNLGDDFLVRQVVREVSAAVDHKHVVNVGGPGADAVVAPWGARARSVRLGTPGYRSEVLQAVSRSRLLVIGGGGLFHDRVPNFYRPFTRIAGIARALRVPYVVYGIGSYPPETPGFARELGRLARGAAAIAVRDPQSAVVMQTAGGKTVSTVPDPAFAGEFPEQLERVPSESAVVGVSLRPLVLEHRSGRDNEAVLKALLDAVAQGLISAASDRSLRVRLLPMQIGGPESDVPVLKQLAERLGARVEVESHDISVESLASRIGGCDVVIGMRLHSLIIATGAEVPCIGINYEAKVAAMMEQTGQSDACVALDVSAARVHAGLSAALDLRRSRPAVPDVRNVSRRELANFADRCRSLASSYPTGFAPRSGSGIA